MESKMAGVTFKVAVPEIEPEAAVIVALFPANRPVASPEELIVATVTDEELQETVLVMSCVLPLT